MASVQVVLHECCHVLFALQVAVVAVVGVRKIRRYNLQLNQLYADTENKSLHGIKVLLYLLVAASVLAVLVNHLGRHRFDGSLWLALPSLAFSALVFSIGWAGMFRRFSIRDMEEVVSCREENEDSACQEVLQPMASERLEREGGELLPQEELQEQEPEVLEESLGDRIERLMREEKVFLQHDLRLDDVARMLNTNRTYLLKAISETKGMTFKEYVNRLRIAHATQLMADNPQLTKSEVATASGYNTVSSFYRNYNLYAKK
jgi:AraC-like DNA-binding protein